MGREDVGTVVPPSVAACRHSKRPPIRSSGTPASPLELQAADEGEGPTSAIELDAPAGHEPQRLWSSNSPISAQAREHLATAHHALAAAADGMGGLRALNPPARQRGRGAGNSAGTGTVCGAARAALLALKPFGL